MGLGTRPYDHGLLDLGDGSFAWLQPDGGWGWSNAGLVVADDQSLVVDTLFDLKLTGEMLAAMHQAVPHAMQSIDTLVNTHSNADHTNGNELVGDAEIISSRATAQEMTSEDPSRLATMMRRAPSMGTTGEYLEYCFGSFDFEGITHTTPTRTFDNEISLSVGDKQVHLKQVGPCHTAGDILVHVKTSDIMYTGDILFIEGHPILWVGPVSNWIQACNYILDLGVTTIVPGHGPITDANGVTAVRDYLEYISREAKKRFDAGFSVLDAALDISLTDYDSWGDSERIGVNVATLYREFGDAGTSRTDMFELMATIHRSRRR